MYLSDSPGAAKYCAPSVLAKSRIGMSLMSCIVKRLTSVGFELKAFDRVCSKTWSMSLMGISSFIWAYFGSQRVQARVV